MTEKDEKHPSQVPKGQGDIRFLTVSDQLSKIQIFSTYNNVKERR